ncbi:glycosyltransferase [Carbonactinospora thermoautotrophica]|uniref:Glycosyltransferase n=1 Tax=Carbonactinospora thermoautotrophica TaxID=1469144 RepID=A0A132N227_9ACTN|nr:methyltransferase domain-containing protein [Carbonactinospora thermoautotrophica]KWX02561.1 Uncharacterized protein LI90_3604 [Carbonactinospora thermoautotrophica]KWX03652.1 glycosyltransferase [Carbonactinospora thermoautotrophica]KWX07892.1 glycosyltransferase [Carbonactinospora thermoautotrophica]
MRDTDSLSPAQVDKIRRQLVSALASPAITHGLARTFRAALKEIELYKNHWTSRRQYPHGVTDLATSRIQIGGGNHRIAGFLNIDLVPPADLIWDVREGIPLADGTAEFVFSEHFLEHIDYPRSAKLFAREVHRILAPEGQVVTGVPDARFVLRGYLNGDQELFAEMLSRWYANRDCLDDFNTYLDLVNYVFRDQDDSAKYSPHYWAYDYDKLVNLFIEARFSRVEPWTFDPAIANPKRAWGSLYVIATK